VLPAPGSDGALAVPPEVQAVIASSAAAPAVSTTTTLRRAALGPPARGIEEDLTITHHARRSLMPRPITQPHTEPNTHANRLSGNG
jgi:hypothetical protein